MFVFFFNFNRMGKKKKKQLVLYMCDFFHILIRKKLRQKMFKSIKTIFPNTSDGFNSLQP